ncbi:C2 family cysteine protease [Antribacter gilvus]|uniref:C2 family cysteine protease n=1 Tax=Antribacter gilvus TaxID=2304675 RepID=UPI0013DED268|nr:C2 family cysteine protease [Antribacter gilvus]
MYGADVEQLRALGRAITRHGEDLESSMSQVASAVTSSPWRGPVRDRFLETWRTEHTSAVRAAVASLAEAGRGAAVNADAQERTSTTYDGGSGGNGGSPDPGRGSGGDPSEGPGDKRKEPGDPGDLGDPEDAVNVPLDDAAVGPETIEQGSLADCWFLASAGAVAQQDPEWVKEHIVYDPATGTYTVTFYDDGEPVKITVEDTVLENAAGDPNGDPSWISVYEKAAAVYMGGEYGDIEYDDPAKALEMITGKDTETESLDPPLWFSPPSLSSIGDRVDSGQPVVVSSKDGGGWFGDAPSDKEVVANHVYTVQDVSADGKTITLINPWGPGGGTGSDGETKPGTITMSADEFYDSFGSVTYGSSTK